jgi:uncharacterized protein
MTGDELARAVRIGDYPEMLRRKDTKRLQIWARDYVKPIVRRDILDIADIEKLGQLPHGRLESSAHQG